MSAPEAESPVVRQRRRGGVDLDALAMQEEERTFLLASLNDLEREHEAGDIDDDDYVALKDDYTARAATLLRAIEAGKSSLPGGTAARRPLRTAGLVALVLALGVGTGVAVSQMSGLRLPGEVATGAVRDSSTTLLNEAQGLFQAGELLDAIRTFDEVLKISPGNTEAMAYRGWALFQAGTAAGNVDLLDAAEASIDNAIATDDSYAPALVFKSVILARYHNDPGAAFETVNAALNVQPPPPPDVRELAEQFRSSLAAELGGTMAPPTTSG